CLEQARVLDRDHGLVRKGIDELDLTFGERAHLGAPDEDCTDCLACVDQGDGECGAKTHLKRYLLALGEFICFGQDVCGLNGSPVEDNPPCNGPTHKRSRVLSNRT